MDIIYCNMILETRCSPRWAARLLHPAVQCHCIASHRCKPGDCPWNEKSAQPQQYVLCGDSNLFGGGQELSLSIHQPRSSWNASPREWQQPLAQLCFFVWLDSNILCTDAGRHAGWTAHWSGGCGCFHWNSGGFSHADRLGRTAGKRQHRWGARVQCSVEWYKTTNMYVRYLYMHVQYDNNCSKFKNNNMNINNNYTNTNTVPCNVTRTRTRVFIYIYIHTPIPLCVYYVRYSIERSKTTTDWARATTVPTASMLFATRAGETSLRCFSQTEKTKTDVDFT